jgi:hypothetical protein
VFVVRTYTEYGELAVETSDLATWVQDDLKLARTGNPRYHIQGLTW